MSPRDAHGGDFDVEPVLGLPEQPPEGERILWQGAPAWRALAWRAFGVRLVLAYFAAIGLWSVGDHLSVGAGAAEIGLGLAALLPIAAGAVAVLALMARVTARTAVYTITSRRIAMRIGVALTVTINLPFRWIGSAGLRLHADGTADIPLALTGPTRLAYLMLWPHVRPWRMRQAEPMLRAVPDGARVARILAEALAADVARRAGEAASGSDRQGAREPGRLVAAE